MLPYQLTNREADSLLPMLFLEPYSERHRQKATAKPHQIFK